VTEREISFQNLALDGVELLYRIRFDESENLSIIGPEAEMELAVGDKVLAAKTLRPTDPAHADGTHELRFILPVKNADIERRLGAARALREYPCQLSGVVKFSTGSTRFECRVEERVGLPRFHIPSARLTDVELPDVSFKSAEMNFITAVENSNVFSLDLRGTSWRLVMEGKEISILTPSLTAMIGPLETRELTLRGEVQAAGSISRLFLPSRIRRAELKPLGSIETPHGTVDLVPFMN
jgi:hypothetical protein